MRALPNVYSVQTLAREWGCSESHVRNLISSGDLRSFRLGGKLLRIRAAAVEEYECRNGELPSSQEDTASHGTKETSGDVIDLGQMIRRKRPAAPRLDTHN